MEAKTAGPVMILAGVLLLSSGCQQSRPFEDWGRDHDRVADIERSMAAHPADGGTPSSALRESRRSSLGDGNPTLDALLADAIAANSEIEAARRRVEQIHERIAQAGAPPNPMGRVQFGQMDMDFVVGLEQRLPFPGTLHARREVARQEVEQTRLQLEAVIQRVEAEVRRSYWAYVGLSGEIEVLERNRQLLERIENIVQARVRVGVASQGDLLRVSRRISDVQNRMDDLGRRRETAMAMLRRITRRPALMAITLPPTADSSLAAPSGNLDDRSGSEAEVRDSWFDGAPIHLDAHRLAELAGHQNPVVRGFQAEAEGFRRRLTLARRERLPELIFGVQYGRMGSGGGGMGNRDDEIMGMVGVGIPIWSGRDDAREREALRGVGRAGAQTQAARDTLRFEVEEAIARVESNQSMLQRLERHTIPDAEQIIELAMASYRTGGITLIQLLDDWERLLNDQADRVRVITEIHRAMADLIQALGGPLPLAPLGE